MPLATSLATITSRPLVLAIVTATSASSTIDSCLSLLPSSSTIDVIAAHLGRPDILGKPRPGIDLAGERLRVGRARRWQVDEIVGRAFECPATDPGGCGAVE